MAGFICISAGAAGRRTAGDRADEVTASRVDFSINFKQPSCTTAVAVSLKTHAATCCISMQRAIQLVGCAAGNTLVFNSSRQIKALGAACNPQARLAHNDMWLLLLYCGARQQPGWHRCPLTLEDDAEALWVVGCQAVLPHDDMLATDAQRDRVLVALTHLAAAAAAAGSNGIQLSVGSSHSQAVLYGAQPIPWCSV